MSNDVLKCGHCGGSGTCHNGPDNTSCDSCLSPRVVLKTGFFSGKRKTVKCNTCNGTGYVSRDKIR